MSGHHHHHHHSDSLAIIFWVNLLFAVIEMIGSYMTGSVAIASDALHDFGDSLVLGFAYVMEKKSKKAATRGFTYGFQRLSVLSGLVTGLVLIVGSIFIVSEAWQRLSEPSMPHTTGMIGLAILGVIVNGFMAARIYRSDSLNTRMISWHLIEDVLGWALVLVTALVMSVWEMPLLDPLLSILFSLVILRGVSKSLHSTMRVFLQGAPDGVSVNEIHEELLSIKGVCDVHDFHIWTLDGEQHVMTCHLSLDSSVKTEDAETIKRLAKQLIERHGPIHTTLELDWGPCGQKGCGP